MNFSDLRFWIALCGWLIAVGLLRPIWARLPQPSRQRFDLLALAVVSFGLFWQADTLSCGILAAELSLVYGVLQWSKRTGPVGRATLLSALILVQLSILGYFKYSRFLVVEVVDLPLPFWDAAIPAGISFYTFQLIALAVDTTRSGLPLPPLLHVGTFTAFFPQLVAGPIERRASLLPQLEAFSFRILPENVRRALPIIVLGLFYKLVLADNVAGFLRIESAENPFIILLTTLLFGFRIYFDFCGYSLIAVGLGVLLGVNLTYNFLAPYSSFNIREFWQRWHVTLSTWLRDYVYRPLGGNRSGSWMLNTSIVFLISGIWHGAGLNFIFWGAMHGAFMIIYGLYRRTGFQIPRPFAASLTFSVVTLSWLPFYETSVARLQDKVLTLLDLRGYNLEHLLAVQKYYALGDRPTLLMILVLCGTVLGFEYRSRELQNPYAPMFDRRVTAVLTAAIILLAAGSDSQFLYFAF